MPNDSLSPLLRTARIELAAVTPGDSAKIGQVVLRNLDHLRPWVPWAANEPLDDAERATLVATWCQGQLDGTQFNYLIRHRDDPQLLGLISAYRRVGPGGIELGYWIDSQAQGRGTITEAALLLTHACLALDDVHRVEVHADPKNTPSLAIPKRLGFTREGILRARWRVADESWRDTEYWSLVQGDPLPPNPLVSE